MIKKNWIYLLFAFSVILFTVTRFIGKAQQHTNEIKISLKIFQTNIGWGYDVMTNDSIYIHQEYIPALAGRKGFATEAEALTIGNLVLAKIKHKKLPVVSLKELDSCGIRK